jgi:uncharacterized protein DUF2817
MIFRGLACGSVSKVRFFPMLPAPEQCFFDSYRTARAAFVEAASAAGAKSETFTHPSAIGAAGEPIQIDLAAFGRAGAPRILLVVSGTHGLEGPAGSAAQIALIRSGLLSGLPDDLLVLLVHALNAWGFANGSRTTENNVDLNRNFIDWRRDPPPNAGYPALHEILCPRDWTRESLARAKRSLDDWIATHGRGAYLDVLLRGQYAFPDGLGFGGEGPEWSNLTLKRILRGWCARAERVAVIDWHTGIGGYGEPFFLCFNAPGGDLQKRCLRWWGQPAAAPAFSEGEERPGYTGLVFNGVESLLSGAEVAGGVIEIGTRPVDEMLAALRVDRWLRFAAADARSDADRQSLRRDLAEAYCPQDPNWRASVVAHATELHRRTLEGLQAWH